MEAGGSSPGHQSTAVQAPFIHSSSCGELGAVSGLCRWLILNSGTQMNLPAWTWFNTVYLDWSKNKFCDWLQSALSCWKCRFMKLFKLLANGYVFCPSEDNPSSPLLRSSKIREQMVTSQSQIQWEFVHVETPEERIASVCQARTS